MLKSAGLVREVTNFDRSMFNAWSTSWEMPFDVICYVATLAEGTLNPMQYINKILKDYKAQGITTVEKAKQQKIKVDSDKVKKVNNANVKQNTYNTSELNSLFASLDEVSDD